jgi:hypothetical protein
MGRPTCRVIAILNMCTHGERVTSCTNRSTLAGDGALMAHETSFTAEISCAHGGEYEDDWHRPDDRRSKHI